MQKDIFNLIAVIFFLMFCVVPCSALDRCKDYETDVRIEHIKYFGNSYPYWYALGQLRQESNCRANATAFDCGQGIAQFMPATAKEINRQMKANLNPYCPEQAIRMQAFYMSRIHRRNATKKLFIDYQGYNGGEGNIKKELARAGQPDWNKMKAVCQRKTITLKSGQKLSFCEVNYDYSRKVYKYGQSYKRGVDKFIFW
jgi:hypothetical protein